MVEAKRHETVTVWRDAKGYLQQLQKLDTVIRQKINELDELREMAAGFGSADYSKERVRSSPSHDAPFVHTVNRIIDLDAEINREIDDFVEEKHKIINQIQGLNNPDYISLLFKRYVEFKKFETIAIELNYTYQYVLNMHGHALKEFESTYIL